ncbi:IS66 family insertion sequence element accessory protein TnpB [Enterococcus faecium]|uniref:IS66 family insertion sequence element accessory protein TnpB n=1 Tax=Enterococcus faecium TaxID=1352 RepID=UPI00349F703B
MLYDLLQTKHIYIVCGKTDLRKGIDGLASLIQQEYQLELYEDAVFLFCGNRQDRFKLLYWDGDGFLLCYKRIENGKQIPGRKTKFDSIEPTGSTVVRRITRSTCLFLPGKRRCNKGHKKCVEPLIFVRFLWYSVQKNQFDSRQENFGTQIRCFSCFKKPIKPIKHNNKPFRILQLKSNY